MVRVEGNLDRDLDGEEINMYMRQAREQEEFYARKGNPRNIFLVRVDPNNDNPKEIFGVSFVYDKDDLGKKQVNPLQNME